MRSGRTDGKDSQRAVYYLWRERHPSVHINGNSRKPHHSKGLRTQQVLTKHTVWQLQADIPPLNYSTSTTHAQARNRPFYWSKRNWRVGVWPGDRALPPSSSLSITKRGIKRKTRSLPYLNVHKPPDTGNVLRPHLRLTETVPRI